MNRFSIMNHRPGILNSTFKGWLGIASCLVLILILLSSCSQTERRERRPIAPIPPQSPPPESTQQESSASRPAIVDATKPVVAPPPVLPETEIGLLLTVPDSESVDYFMDKALEYSVTHVQFGRDILDAVDDLILNQNRRDFVRTAAKKAKNLGISPYIWSREINIEGQTFPFNWAAPLVAARQSAYRSVLESIPEIEGVVLTFEDALLKPWDAVIPEGLSPLSVPQRIQFVIDMVHSVVVDEFDKRLLVRVKTGFKEHSELIMNALKTYPSDQVTIISGAYYSGLDPLSPWEPIVPQSLPHRQLLECDLTASALGGNFFLTCMPDDLYDIWSCAQSRDMKGVVGLVQKRNYSIRNTPHEITWFALSKMVAQPGAPLDLIWDEAIQRQYGLFPASEEGQQLQKILSASSDWWRRAAVAKGLLVFSYQGEIPAGRNLLDSLPSLDSIDENAALEFLIDELKSPKKQTLIDLAQEAYEVSSWFDNALSNLNSISPNLVPTQYEQIRRRLATQRFYATAWFYIKQCFWGFKLWQRTKDENEALYLEAHLKELEKIAKTHAQKMESLPHANVQRIWDFVAGIREEFPRVILGWKKREWNRLNEIHIKQAGPESVIISWTSEMPSTSRVFVTTHPPLFELTKPATNKPTTQHQVRIHGLNSDKQYVFKVQCMTADGDITTSGDYTFHLKPEPFL